MRKRKLAYIIIDLKKAKIEEKDINAFMYYG